ncbi:MAG: hypothetical protein E6J71_04740 [Deltaproteobacteria bacterium]|nr:MAG: hypothetical protein E6J76_08250 [Deltaproteobacteria bacterium]TMB22956.1 MAG: hypothetical protein E6J71_04740 [Deltaproteobacteria bacterium]
MDWKRYPYAPDWGDPRWFTFPDVDDYQPKLGIATYFLDGFLRGRTSGRQYAFMVIVTDTKVLRKRVRAAFYTFALYDCDRRHYGTYTDYDFPRPPRIRRRYKLDATEQVLGLRYRTSAGEAVWCHARNGDGTLRPFAWDVRLVGVDHHGARMASRSTSRPSGRPRRSAARCSSSARPPPTRTSRHRGSPMPGTRVRSSRTAAAGRHIHRHRPRRSVTGFEIGSTPEGRSWRSV